MAKKKKKKKVPRPRETIAPSKKAAARSAKPQVLEPSVDEKLVVREAVDWINRKVTETIDRAARGALEIGQYVFKRFFHDNPEEVRFRGRQKETSFRELASHPELQISPSNLHNAVHLAIQEHQLITAGVQSSEQITPSHKVELLRVKELEDKARLVSQAVDERLSVRQLRERIDRLSTKLLPSATSSATGELRIPRPIVALINLNIERAAGEKRLRKLSDKQLGAYQQTVERAQEALATIIKQVERVRAGTNV